MAARSLTARSGQRCFRPHYAPECCCRIDRGEIDKAIEVIAVRTRRCLHRNLSRCSMALAWYHRWPTAGRWAIAFYLPRPQRFARPAAGPPSSRSAWLFLDELPPHRSLFPHRGAASAVPSSTSRCPSPWRNDDLRACLVGVGTHSEIAIAAMAFPLSSPFAMFGRAAELPDLWPHAIALVWQILWVALILRLAARLFRRSVLKSGPAFRWPWQKKAAA